jgi:hypothetical protein
MSRQGAALELRAEKKFVVVGDEGSDPFEALEAALQASCRAIACLRPEGASGRGRDERAGAAC